MEEGAKIERNSSHQWYAMRAVVHLLAAFLAGVDCLQCFVASGNQMVERREDLPVFVHVNRLQM